MHAPAVAAINARARIATRSSRAPTSRLRRRPPSSQGGDLPQRVAAHRRHPAYHCASRWKPLQPTATVFAYFHSFGGRPVATGCEPLQPQGSIKAPYFVASADYNGAFCTDADAALRAEGRVVEVVDWSRP